MTQAYSDPARKHDPYALPDIEVFQLTAEEAAELDEDMVYEYLKQYPLATMNSRDLDKLFTAMVEQEGIRGGWFWHCLPDGPPTGPFDSYQEALDDAQAY